jgi:ABC-2 type transport system permease protein
MTTLDELRATQPMLWSVRRELWENRSVTLAPLVVAGVVLVALLINMAGLPAKMRTLPANDPEARHAIVVAPASLAPAPIMFATFLVGLFYCIDALYGERRDRSILFWKSLPISDRGTVLSKLSIPMVVLPLIAAVLGFLVQGILLFVSTIVLVVNGMSPALLWSEFRPLPEIMIMVYGLVVHALWLAPIYAWLLLVSGWARRAPMLWAIFPSMLIAMLERMAFQTSHFATFIGYRLMGASTLAFDMPQARTSYTIPILDDLTHMTPLRFFTTPGLWLGLIVAAVLAVATVRLRQRRAPS